MLLFVCGVCVCYGVLRLVLEEFIVDLEVVLLLVLVEELDVVV